MDERKKEKLRVGLLMGSYLIPAWQLLLLQKINNSSISEIKLIVIDGKEPNEPCFEDLIRNGKHFLYFLYSQIDEKIIKQERNALEIKNSKKILQGIPEIHLFPRPPGSHGQKESQFGKKIKEIEIDVFLNLGTRKPSAEIFNYPKYGVWSYCFGDNRLCRGGPVGFWEIYENSPVTVSMLVMLKEKSLDFIPIYRSIAFTDWISPFRNKNKLYWKSSSFVLRKLSHYHTFGKPAYTRDLKSKIFRFDDMPSSLEPNNSQTFFFLTRLAKKYLKEKILSAISRKQWQLMFRFGDGISRSFYQFKKIVPPRDRFWADPHVVFKDDKYFIFIEEFEYQKNKGCISVIQMDKEGNFSPPEKIIEKPYHLSYPFIFEWNSNYYMVPETSENRTMDIYKCIDFPLGWEFHKRVFENIHAVDTTLFYLNDKWWLFTNIIENRGATQYDELFLFYADNPFSDKWESHALNPVVSDIRRARPAGSIFEYEGEYYRPSQNSAGRYGRGLNLSKIIKLDEMEYEEVMVGKYEPQWDKNLIGFHTLSYNKDLTVIDVLLRRSKFPFWNKKK